MPISEAQINLMTRPRLPCEDQGRGGGGGRQEGVTGFEPQSGFIPLRATPALVLGTDNLCMELPDGPVSTMAEGRVSLVP